MSVYFPTSFEREAFLASLSDIDLRSAEVRELQEQPRGREIMCFAQGPAGVHILRFPIALRLDASSLVVEGDTLPERLTSIQPGRPSAPEIQPELREAFEEIGQAGIYTAAALQRHLQADAYQHVCETFRTPEAHALGQIIRLQDERESWSVVRRMAETQNVLKQATSSINAIDLAKSDFTRSHQIDRAGLPETLRTLVFREQAHVNVVDRISSLAEDARLPETIRETCRGVSTMSRDKVREAIQSCRVPVQRLGYDDLTVAFSEADRAYGILSRPRGGTTSALERAYLGAVAIFEGRARFLDVNPRIAAKAERYVELIRDGVHAISKADRANILGIADEGREQDLQVDLVDAPSRARDVDISEGR